MLEEHENVIKLWNNGLSYAQIVTKTGISKGKVAGLIYRARKNGLEVRLSRPENLRGKKMEVEDNTPILEEITVYMLKSGQCKYPTHLNEFHEHVFCAKPTLRSYCDEHHTRCHGRQISTQRSIPNKYAPR